MIIAQTDWSQTAIALGGIFLVTSITVVIVWQIFKTGRAGITSSQQKEYRGLAEQTTEFQSRIDAQLSQANQILQDMDGRLAEIERLLKEV